MALAVLLTGDFVAQPTGQSSCKNFVVIFVLGYELLDSLLTCRTFRKSPL